MMDITRSREEFEKWLKSRDCNPVAWLKDAHWEVWKASRESLEVDLPEKVFEECEFDRGHNFGIDYCIISLEEAGIRINGESE